MSQSIQKQIVEYKKNKNSEDYLIVNRIGQEKFIVSKSFFL